MARKWSNLNLPGALHYVTGNFLDRMRVFAEPECCRVFPIPRDRGRGPSCLAGKLQSHAFVERLDDLAEDQLCSRKSGKSRISYCSEGLSVVQFSFVPRSEER